MKNDRSLDDEELRQDKLKAEGNGAVDTTPAVEMPVCACVEDLLAALFLEPRSSPARGNDVLRRFTCPSCGRVYLTNAVNDLCLDCREKGVQPPETGVTSES